MRAKLLKQVENLVNEELQLSMEKFPLFHSAHEGFAIILEELIELHEELEDSGKIHNSIQRLWSMVRNNSNYKDTAINQIEQHAINAACEAIQVAAMCRKFKESEKRWQK